MGEKKRGPKPKDRAPTPLRGIPAPPGHLPLVGKKHWYAVAALIDEAGSLSTLDQFALEQYCCLYSRWLECQKELSGGKLYVTISNGAMQKHPLYDVSVQCQRDMLRYLIQFGLTPAARAKLAAPEPEKVDDKWAAFDAG